MMELDRTNNDRSYLWGRFMAVGLYIQPNLRLGEYQNFQTRPFALVGRIHDKIIQSLTPDNQEFIMNEIGSIMDLFDVESYSNPAAVDKSNFFLGCTLETNYLKKEKGE